MRLIDADTLVKAIKRMYCTDCNSYDGVRCRACSTGDALDMIEDEPTVDAEPVWISVKDRLPEEAGNVIMLISGISAPAFYLSNEKFKSWNGYLHEAGNPVTHWMPLPEPPKEDSHE